MATRSTTKTSITQGGRTIYLSNKELLAEVKLSKEKGRMSDMLARMLQLLCSKYAKKGNFVNYSYNEDMQAYAMMMLVRTWNSFDPEKSNNPFAFFTQCIKHSFIQYLNQEKRQRDVRDALLVDIGLNPSYGYEGDGPRGIEDEQDFESIKRDADQLAATRFIDTPIERDDKGEEIMPVHIYVEDEASTPEDTAQTEQTEQEE